MDLGNLVVISERRECVVCGRVFRTGRDRDGVERSALQYWVEHCIEHQPTAEQWTEAYERIRRATTRARTRVETGTG